MPVTPVCSAQCAQQKIRPFASTPWPITRQPQCWHTGASAWMMTREWDARHVFLLWAMWAVMMAGMMLPSAAPLLLLYGAAARRRAVATRAVYEIYALAAGYVTMWSLFSIGAAAVQRVLSMLLVLSPMMTLTIGTPICRHFSVERAIASAWPRSSAPLPG